MIISEEVGVAKPDPRAFDLAFAELGHPPRSQVLMIGDSLSSDIAGASGYDLDTCWYDPTGQATARDLTPTHRIDALGQLLTITG